MSVGIKINLEVAMNEIKIKKQVYKTISKMFNFFVVVTCIWCISFAPLTRAYK